MHHKTQIHSYVTAYTPRLFCINIYRDLFFKLEQQLNPNVLEHDISAPLLLYSICFRMATIPKLNIVSFAMVDLPKWSHSLGTDLLHIC